MLDGQPKSWGVLFAALLAIPVRANMQKPKPAGYKPSVTVEYRYGVDPPRPPGKLLLNMLIKNEAAHLERTLPLWAKVIDHWIIGVDDHNTDESPEIIMKHLGHIPGEIVIVEFDGMGPTWSKLVEIIALVSSYPNASHGIIADADFSPMLSSLDKSQLDYRCSKHMYTIWTQDHRNERKMDWMYRNIPGAVVRRRTHQIVEVPELPEQEVFQTLVDLPIEERDQGYGDRSGTKNQRYISWLEKDLLDYPGDTRTLYYLGYAHFDIYNQGRQSPGGKVDIQYHLKQGISYFQLRAENAGGNEEELWFTLLKLGEIFERFKGDWHSAEKYYTRCTESDKERADAWFYLGQHYRLADDIPKALPYLYTAASLQMPERSLFQWHYLYLCLSKLEYARALSDYKKTPLKQFKEGIRILKRADCSQGDPGNQQEKLSLLKTLKKRVKKKEAKAGQKRLAGLTKLLKALTTKIDDLETSLQGDYGTQYVYVPTRGQEEQSKTAFDALLRVLDLMNNFRLEYEKEEAASKETQDSSHEILTCRAFRLATSPYLKFFKRYESDVEDMLGDSAFFAKWKNLNQAVLDMCRTAPAK